MKDTFKKEIEQINAVLLSIERKEVKNTTLKHHALSYLRDGVKILKTTV